MKKFVCPNCHSENIQKCSIIYKSGTHTHQSTTTINGNVEAETSGSGSTVLAQEVAPPVKKESSWGAMIVCAAIGFFCVSEDILWGGVIGAVLAAACYFESQDADKFNNEEYPALYNQWLNTYICHRCGHKFTLN